MKMLRVKTIKGKIFIEEGKKFVRETEGFQL